jgi:hypothetical protein
MPDLPSRNDGVTIAGRTLACPICERGFSPTGRRRFCSDACRQAAWRARRPVVPVVPLTHRSPRPSTIYECPACETRSLGDQRCPDCNTFARRVGPGGLCPHCDEPVAVSDLLISEGGVTLRLILHQGFTANVHHRFTANVHQVR